MPIGYPIGYPHAKRFPQAIDIRNYSRPQRRAGQGRVMSARRRGGERGALRSALATSFFHSLGEVEDCLPGSLPGGMPIAGVRPRQIDCGRQAV